MIRKLLNILFIATVPLFQDALYATQEPETVKTVRSSSADFYNAFGFYSEENLLKIQESDDITLRNFLIENNISTSVRTLFLKTSPCGMRQYQFISRSNKSSGREYVITYQCDNSCLGVVEGRNKKVRYKSEPVTLPESLCKIFWGGSIKLQDKGSL